MRFAEPLNVAIHVSRRSQAPSGAKVLVFRAGAAVLLCAHIARYAKVGIIIIIIIIIIIADAYQRRIDFTAREKFADVSHLIPKERSATTEENLKIARSNASDITSLRDSNGHPIGDLDIVFECTGAESCVQTSIFAAKSRLESLITHQFEGIAAAKGAFDTAARTSDDEGNLVIMVVATM